MSLLVVISLRKFWMEASAPVSSFTCNCHALLSRYANHAVDLNHAVRFDNLALCACPTAVARSRFFLHGEFLQWNEEGDN